MLHLTYHADTKIPVEVDGLAPDRLIGLSALQVSKLPVQHGNRARSLGDFFGVQGDATDQNLVIEGDCRCVKRIGAEMKSGTITIHGDVGMHLGADMTGGEIVVHGSAGDWAGAEMIGGRNRIHGNAGHQLGSGYRGARHGMRGGEILVDGSAGNEVGASMRRGFIAVGGTAGDFAGIDLIAGSIFLFGASGQRLGAGMKRGTIALFADHAPLLPTFTYACEGRPVFASLYLKRLADGGFRPAADKSSGRFRRYCGDRLALGLGEILVWKDNS